MGVLLQGALDLQPLALEREGRHLFRPRQILQQGGQITIEDETTHQKKLQEDNFYYAEPQFFNMFNFPFIAGNAQAALNNPNSAVLTQATAEKYFGNWKTALGKTIKYQNKTLFTVRGILKNI